MKLNPLEQLLTKSSNEELDEIMDILVNHIIDWLEEKPLKDGRRELNEKDIYC